MNQELTKALELLNTHVGATMGPNGGNVSLESMRGRSHRITKDGATVARALWSEDNHVSGYIKNVAEIATSVEDEVGDGTTTATVMGTTLLNDLIKLTKDHHPRKIIKDINPIIDFLIETSKNLAKSADDDTALNIARVSTNHDEDMASLVADVVHAIGPYGRFKISTGGETDVVQTINGYTIDSGVISDSILNSFDGRKTIESKIIHHNGELGIKDLATHLNGFDEAYLVIIADRIKEDDVLEIMQYLHKTNSSTVGVYPITLSSIPSVRVEQRQDISNLVGDRVKVTMERNKTTFHLEDKEKIDTYAEKIWKLLTVLKLVIS